MTHFMRRFACVMLALFCIVPIQGRVLSGELSTAALLVVAAFGWVFFAVVRS